jgi:hypothetical protein
MKPPTFEEAKEPLDADAWIRAIEVKFSVFTFSCSEERKASFAALQLRGAALIWWENFKTMIPAGHQITWAEFKQAFKEHHIPKGLMDSKMKELLALKQVSDTVYEYAKKFNALCQYGGHHVDNDAKKIERFRDGLHGDLYERINLYEPNNYQDLVNKAISQEDAMSKAQRDRKRQVRFTATGGSGKKFRFIKKGTQGPPQSSSTGHWRVTPSQNKPSENFQFHKAQQPFKPSAPPTNNNNSATKDSRCYNCGQPGHYANECPKPRQNKQGESSGFRQGHQVKKSVVQVKQGKLNFTTLADIPEGAAVLTGTFSVRDHPVRILFDSGATHSFISESLVRKLGLHSCHTKDSFVVATAGGRNLSNTNQSHSFAARQQNLLNQPNSIGIGRSRCDSSNELVDPTSSCFGYCH